MSPPRKKKSSRKGRQQKIEYRNDLQFNFRLQEINHKKAEERNLPHDKTKDQAGGRRSMDKYSQGLSTYWTSFSAREKEVVFHVCRGLSDAEIAGELDLAYSTVKSYLQNIFFKANVRNRKQLIARFARFDFPFDTPTDGAMEFE